VFQKLSEDISEHYSIGLKANWRPKEQSSKKSINEEKKQIQT